MVTNAIKDSGIGMKLYEQWTKCQVVSRQYFQGKPISATRPWETNGSKPAEE